MRMRNECSSLAPRTRRDRFALFRLAGEALLIAAILAGLLYNKHREQVARERDWVRAQASLEDARAYLAGNVSSEGGGAMLYNVEVLARYEVDGAPRERWTTLAQRPKALGDAQLQASLLKGKRCLVYWKAEHPERILAAIQ